LVILPPKACIEYALFPLSNGIGALVCGSLVQWFGFFWMYAIGATIAAGGLVITIVNRARLK